MWSRKRKRREPDFVLPSAEGEMAYPRDVVPDDQRGGDAVAPRPTRKSGEDRDVMTERGAGESGSPLPESKLRKRLYELVEEWERKGNDRRNDHTYSFVAEEMRSILDHFKPSPESTSGEEGKRNGAQLIAAERERQVSEEGWTPEHDDMHSSGEISDGAIAYIIAADLGIFAGTKGGDPHEWWPFTGGFNPSGDDDPIRDLTKAGALIAAEIDRLQRAASPSTPRDEESK